MSRPSVWEPVVGRKEGHALFNDTLNTFYLRLKWYRTTQIAREDTHCRHMGYSFRLAARIILYAPYYRYDNTYHGLCCTRRRSLAGTRNNSTGPPWRIDPKIHRTMSERSYHGATSRSCQLWDANRYAVDSRSVTVASSHAQPVSYVSTNLWRVAHHFPDGCH